MFLELPAFGNVPGDVGGAVDSAIGTVDGGHGQGDVDRLSVLANADGFEGLDPSAAADALEDLGFFVDPVGRAKHADVAADRFARGVPVDDLRAAIPALDDAVEVLGNNGVLGRFDDGA